MNLGEKIYKLRAERNLSQGDLAEMLNVSRQSISKWENNSSVPDLDKIIKLGDIFEISLDELIKGECTENKIKQEVVRIENTSRHSKNKIVGIVLLCMSFFALLVFALLGGVLAGIIFSIPFIVCGVICLVFDKNVGLWCTWAVYFLIELYFSYATGINRSLVLYTFLWTADMNYARLILGWLLLLFIIILIGITVIRIGKTSPIKQAESKKVALRAWIIVGAVYGLAMIWSRTGIYKSFLTDLNYNTFVFRLISIAISWAKIITITIAGVHTSRHIHRNKKSTK